MSSHLARAGSPPRLPVGLLLQQHSATHVALAHVPDRDREPPDRNTQEAAGDDVAEKMEVGTDEANGNGGNADGVERAEPGIANPQYRHHGANGGRVSGRKCGISRPTMERIEAKDAVANERRVVAHPGFGPGAPKGKLQLIL